MEVLRHPVHCHSVVREERRNRSVNSNCITIECELCLCSGGLGETVVNEHINTRNQRFMTQNLLKCVVKPSRHVVKNPVLMRHISDCRASIIHRRLCHHCTACESQSLIDYTYQEYKTHSAEPISVSNTIESRSIKEPEPVLMSTAVCRPFERPDRPPSNCWNDSS